MLQQFFASIPKWLYFLLVLVAFELVADVLAKQFAIRGKFVFTIYQSLALWRPIPPGS